MTSGAEPMEPLRDPYPPEPPPGQDDLPCDDGEPMETPRHRDQMNLLIHSLRAAWPERRDVFIGGNMFVYYSRLQTRRNDFRGPDFFVVLGALPDRERKSWVVWEEAGKLPDLVVELASPSTEDVDRGRKKDIYERVWHLPEYFVYDPWSQRLDGWRLVSGRYDPIAPEPDGTLASTVLGLRLVVRDGQFNGIAAPWLRWLDPVSGELLPTAEERLDDEKRRADALAAEVAELKRRSRARARDRRRRAG